MVVFLIGVYPSMRHSQWSTCDGDGTEACQDSYVILSGGHNHINSTFRGCILHNDDAHKQSNLIFKNYMGILSSSIIGFENIEIKENSHVNLTSSYLYNNSDWILDIRRRSIDYSNISLFKLTNNNLTFPKFNLIIDENNTLSAFTLLECPNMNLLNQFDDSMDIIYNSQQIYSIYIPNLSNSNNTNNIIHDTGTIWDGYGLVYNGSNKIIFCNPNIHPIPIPPDPVPEIDLLTLDFDVQMVDLRADKTTNVIDNSIDILVNDTIYTLGKTNIPKQTRIYLPDNKLYIGSYSSIGKNFITPYSRISEILIKDENNNIIKILNIINNNSYAIIDTKMQSGLFWNRLIFQIIFLK